MLNLKNNENYAVSMKFAKKAKNKIKFKKVKGTFFRQRPLAEKSPTSTDRYINKLKNFYF